MLDYPNIYMPIAWLWLVLVLVQPCHAAEPSVKPIAEQSPATKPSVEQLPGTKVPVEGPTAVKLLSEQPPQKFPSDTFTVLEAYAHPNPIVDNSIPVFYLKLTQAADVVEFRVYTITLELVHAKEFDKPTKSQKGESVYEYSWQGAASLPKGVYFFLFRASKKGHATVKEMKHIKIAR